MVKKSSTTVGDLWVLSTLVWALRHDIEVHHKKGKGWKKRKKRESIFKKVTKVSHSIKPHNVIRSQMYSKPKYGIVIS